MDTGLVLIVLVASAIVATLLALVAAWSPAAGVIAITLALAAAVMVRPD